MKEILFCIVLVFIFSGCQTTYKHPIKDAQDFDRDLRECERNTKHSASLFFHEELKKCLQQSGWIQGNKD
jgi:hypothetical protein